MGTRILVTGATGFLGRHLMPRLIERYGRDDVKGVSSRDYDLMDPAGVERMFAEQQPSVLVHLAAYSAGIGANSSRPADFFHINSTLTTLTFRAAAEAGIDKLIYTMGGCSYPATADSPIGEEQMWNGYPQEESAGYSMAKKMGIVAARSYRKQFGLESTVLVPGNMYGEYDNFRRDESHVVPAMLRRFLEAKLEGLSAVDMWGTGAPVRDFVYAGDVADVIPHFLERDEEGPINISSGTRTSIRTLAEACRETVGWQGEIRWDTSKPDGQMEKIFGVERLHGLGLRCDTPLREGLQRTFDWLEKHYESEGDGIRL